MKVAVIGAGISGVCTAYELAAAGHAVEVFEAKGSVAEGASFATAGTVSPTATCSGGAAALRGRLLTSLLGRDTPLRVEWRSATRHLPWLWRGLRAPRQPAYAARRSALWRLAQFSRQRLLSLSASLDLAYEQEPGQLLLLRGERELKALRSELAVWADLGASFELVDADRARQLEPGLHADTPLRAAIHLPQDGVGNCRHYAQLLRAEALRLGVQFHFDAPVQQLVPGQPVQLHLAGAEARSFDAAVVCTGADAPRLLASLKPRLPLLPVRAHAITAPLRLIDGLPTPGPQSGVRDLRHHVSITRLGQRIRVSGGDTLGEGSAGNPDRALATLYRVLDDWFPGAALTREAQHWSGLQATLPDGLPRIGASAWPGVWLNLGHGSHGWTLASGAALVLARRISGQDAGLDLADLG